MFSISGSGWDEVYPRPECVGSCMAGELDALMAAATACVVPIPVGSNGGMG